VIILHYKQKTTAVYTGMYQTMKNNISMIIYMQV